MSRRAAAALLVAIALALAVPPLARWALWHRELNPVLRGAELARREGCVTCHSPDGAREIPNPGSRWGSVPRFGAGNARMYVETRRELEELIRYGAPLSWLEDAAVAERLERQHLRMPAYGETLSDREIRDLVAFAAAIERVEPVGGEAAAAGRRIAREHGCLACHGVEASGGRSNPGSLGGFVPGFLGGNFTDLVRDESEFREWVLEGTSARLEANPIARHFWRRQKIEMPAYRELLSDDEVESLWDWVRAIRADQGSIGAEAPNPGP